MDNKLIKRVILVLVAITYLEYAWSARLIRNIIKAEDIDQSDISVYEYQNFDFKKADLKQKPKPQARTIKKAITLNNEELINKLLGAIKLDVFNFYLNELYKRRDEEKIKVFLKSKLQEDSHLELSLRDRNHNLATVNPHHQKKISFLYHQLAKKFGGTQPYTDMILANASKYRSSLLKGRGISSLSLDALNNHLDKPAVIAGLVRFAQEEQDYQSEIVIKILNQLGLKNIEENCLVESLASLVK